VCEVLNWIKTKNHQTFDLMVISVFFLGFEYFCAAGQYFEDILNKILFITRNNINKIIFVFT
jgi:hypothetical protein